MYEKRVEMIVSECIFGRMKPLGNSSSNPIQCVYRSIDMIRQSLRKWAITIKHKANLYQATCIGSCACGSASECVRHTTECMWFQESVNIERSNQTHGIKVLSK